ncbi:TetR/AcrR family transcriptional regulator [Streptomyces californicus]|uniref:TetR/AcrR family transcriptional regulator n=1 Tax=Streptomyces californicus TaxID=67351 RepID=A0ABD7D185_9ACTN|nr:MULTISPECIES: TetR/AcrR family transcriptional regulator [Streptomyces]QRV28385.1 TetR/AcrR family transcriptional regulator [Streptomyces californicus]QRV35943.1 TetR/AcrR family transcriptional regulator [Streptomyces californicus]QRV41783.1 TetR/AcrR family transcriptional regulator [Streptomyces californicus]QRV48548.1 TetR/AcrR family transcriptional regulator [Streptomyces californicus]
MATTPTRLSKQARREQLLDTAVAIVRTRGADGLTLVTLAEEAGVSRPVVYGHFATRPGLLLALHRRLDERHRAAVTRALRSAATGADAVARAISTAYFACATDMPELGAVTAALKGSPEMEAVRHDSADRYAELMATVLRPYSPLAPKDLGLRCAGVLGAADALAAELNRRRATDDETVAALTGLIMGSLGGGAGRGAESGAGPAETEAGAGPAEAETEAGAGA